MLNKGTRRFNARLFWLFADGDGLGESDGSSTGGAGLTGESPPAGDPGIAPVASTGPDWKTIISPGMAEKPYFKSILESADPGAELIKQFDNAQGLIGKRPVGPPAADASDEDWGKYYETVRPKTADEYDIKPLDLGPEKKEISDFINSHRDEAFIKDAKGMLHKHGLTKKQAEGVASDFDQMYAMIYEKQVNAVKEASVKSEKDFEELVKTNFAGDREKALELGRQGIIQHLPENMRPYLDTLSPEGLLLFAQYGKSVKEKYGTQDTITPNSNVDILSTGTEDDLMAEMQALMAKPGRRNFMDAEHESINARIEVLSKKISEKRSQR